MDYIIVGLIVFSAVFFMVRRLYKTLKSDAPGCCGSCSSCGSQQDARPESKDRHRLV